MEKNRAQKYMARGSARRVTTQKQLDVEAQARKQK